jgi:hypothetical protein
MASASYAPIADDPPPWYPAPMDHDPDPAPRPRLLEQFLASRDVSCPRCRYNLRGLRCSSCPECGSALQLVVAVDPAHWLDAPWIQRASHPLAVAAVAWVGFLLFFGPVWAALPLFLWAGAFGALRYLKWARQHTIGAAAITPIDSRHRAVVLAVVAFAVLVIILALFDRY